MPGHTHVRAAAGRCMSACAGQQAVRGGTPLDIVARVLSGAGVSLRANKKQQKGSQRQQKRTFTGHSLPHSQDMDEIQDHRRTVEQLLAVGGGWQLAVGDPWGRGGEKVQMNHPKNAVQKNAKKCKYVQKSAKKCNHKNAMTRQHNTQQCTTQCAPNVTLKLVMWF